MSYTHLQVHSGYSLLDSAVTIDKLTKKASDLQFEALALTDHEVLYGVIPFYKSCLKYNIKPIVGMTLNILNINNELEYCILLAKNNDGYKQLIKISTMIKKDQKSLSLKEIHLYTGNLICILPVQSSTLENLFMNNSFEEVKKQIDHWINCFHHDFYMGIQDHGVASERKLQLQIKAFHEMYHVPVVAINDVRYIEKDDYVAFDCLQAMKDHNRWKPSNIHPSVQNRHLRSSEEMKLIYDDFWPEPFNNTKVIQQTCNVTFELNKTLLPTYPTPNDVSAHKYLEQLCWESVGEKYHKVTKDVRNRLTYELEVIQSMGFSDYFLIVWDFVQYAKNSNILVGPGRGSAAGSIVAFILGITEVDPLKYNLLFERFLNPERISMPDIDIDFADDRRDEVIQYVREKYGETHVAQIATFGTFGARSLLRELFKTMGVDQQDIYYILNF